MPKTFLVLVGALDREILHNNPLNHKLNGNEGMEERKEGGIRLQKKEVCYFCACPAEKWNAKYPQVLHSIHHVFKEK